MTIDPELLDILVCPETKQPLTVASAELLERLNGAVADDSVVTRGGETVSERVTEGLLREDGQVLYPIRQGIPIMLIDEAIEMGAL